MALELEAKIKVDSWEPVRRRLQSLGASCAYTAIETNRIFDTADRALFKRGCGLRVRTCVGEGAVPRPTITYKGPQQASELKSRDEIETVVEDARAAVALLEALDFNATICFEKRREEWLWDSLKIELDELPRLGCFVEIEGPDESSVIRAQDALGLGSHPTIRESYIALLIEHANATSLSVKNISLD